MPMDSDTQANKSLAEEMNAARRHTGEELLILHHARMNAFHILLVTRIKRAMISTLHLLHNGVAPRCSLMLVQQ